MKKYFATIMVVDDDPNDLFLIERAFRKIGVKDPIHTINGGREAISYMMGERGNMRVVKYMRIPPSSRRI